MKFCILVPDGCGDHPIASLGGKTPLEAAKIKNINEIAKRSKIGLVRTIPEGVEPNSVPANLSILGFDPSVYKTGRAPLETVAAGINLADDETAFRVNLVTLAGSGPFEELIMADHSSSEIENGDAKIFMKHIDESLGDGETRFYPGMGYRCLMVTKKFHDDINFTPPHDILGRETGAHLPKGIGADEIIRLMERGRELLSKHPLNDTRIKNNLNPASGIWIWDGGKKLQLPSIEDKYGVTGSVVAAVNLIKGIGLCAGLSAVDVPGATGTLRTDYAAKGRAAVGEFRKGKDFVYIHVEAPDECSHTNDLEGKIKSLDRIDSEIFGPVHEYLRGCGEQFKILVVTDHKTLMETQTHNAEPVPYVLFESGSETRSEDWKAFSEAAGERGDYFESGCGLADYFFNTK